MNKEQLLELLKEIHPETDFTTETKLIDNGILDSLDIVSLISEIAEEFSIRIPANEITPENFNSLDSLYDMLLRLE